MRRKGRGSAGSSGRLGGMGRRRGTMMMAWRMRIRVAMAGRVRSRARLGSSSPFAFC